MRTGLLTDFFLRTIVWLLLCLAVWYPLGAILAAPVGWIAGFYAQLFLPDVVEGVNQSGATLSLLTHLQVAESPRASAGSMALLTPEAAFMSYGYGLPLLMALFLASRPPRFALKILIGALALLPFQGLSIVFDWLKQLAIVAGPAYSEQLGIGELGRNLIGLGYQFGTLILPTLVPVVIWLALDRKLISTMLLEAYLDTAQPGENVERK